MNVRFVVHGDGPAHSLDRRELEGCVVVTTFHGNEASQQAFLSALERNCDCQVDMNGMTTTRCRLHDALLNDQRWIDHQEFARYLREKLREEEGLRPDGP